MLWSPAKWWWSYVIRNSRLGTGTAFVEFARRLGDFAIAGAAAMLTVHEGICERARLTIVGMGEGPFRARAAEEMLIGGRLEAKNLREAVASVVDQSIRPKTFTPRRPIAGIWQGSWRSRL